jgi:hypothetical protein
MAISQEPSEPWSTSQRPIPYRTGMDSRSEYHRVRALEEVCSVIMGFELGEERSLDTFVTLNPP